MNLRFRQSLDGEKIIERLDWIEQGLTSPPTQYRLSGRQFYRSKDPTNSIKVLKEKVKLRGKILRGKIVCFEVTFEGVK